MSKVFQISSQDIKKDCLRMDFHTFENACVFFISSELKVKKKTNSSYLDSDSNSNKEP